MTPEAIAKQCAEAIRQVRPRQHKNIKNMVLAQQKEVAAKLLPILTAHLAARDEEYARLREAAEFFFAQAECIPGRTNKLPGFRKYSQGWVVYWPSVKAILSKSGDVVFFPNWWEALQAAVDRGFDIKAALTPQQEQGK